MNAISKALEDWEPELQLIVQHLQRPELLAQLAEECAELGKAAMKLRRALDGRNPTPVSLHDAECNLQEELADVLLCAVLVNIDTEEIERTMRRKIPRWLSRIEGEDIQ